MKTVLISGGTGLIGSRLTTLLLEKGYQVKHLSRSKKTNSTIPTFQWDIDAQTIEEEAMIGVDAIIHLAGAGIADKAWTKKRKKEIIESRGKGATLLYKKIEGLKEKPKTFINAAAIGYYGDQGEEWVDELSPPGQKGFLPESCVAWEKSLDQLQDSSIRMLKFRIGIVLSTKGGAMEKLMDSFKVRTAAYLGDGQQFYSWIHLDDMCRVLIAGLENENLSGVYNAVSPNPARNKTIVETIANVLPGKYLMVPAPKFALKLVLGERIEMVLGSTRVSSKKIESTGFQFQFPQLEEAIAHLIKHQL